MNRQAVCFLAIAAPLLALCLAYLGWATQPENILGWFLLLTGVSFIIGGPAYYWVNRKPFWRSTQAGQMSREEQGDRSFWLILPGFLVAFFGSPLERLVLPEVIPRSDGMQWAGTVCIALGVALQIWARGHLRGWYSGHLEVQDGQLLVQSGPYRVIRHPAYAGQLWMALGVGLGYSSLVGLLAIPALLLPGIVYRMHIEENILADHFGERYIQYKRHTKHLIPGVW